MRPIAIALLVVCGLEGCGGGASGSSAGTVLSTPASPFGGASEIAVYSGRTEQSLAISVEDESDHFSIRLAVVLAWRGSCRGAGGLGVNQPLREARFMVEGLPGHFSDHAREPGGDGDATTFFRRIDVRREGDEIRGQFRIRSRSWNGQARAVDRLCDTGQVRFWARSVKQPRVQPITVRRAEIDEASFQEQLSEALATLDSAISTRDPVLFCSALAPRLRRMICTGPSKVTIGRMARLMFLPHDARPARHVGADAIVVVPTGASGQNAAGRFEDVRALRFVAQGSRRAGSTAWQLDHIGPVRQRRTP